MNWNREETSCGQYYCTKPCRVSSLHVAQAAFSNMFPETLKIHTLFWKRLVTDISTSTCKNVQDRTSTLVDILNCPQSLVTVCSMLIWFGIRWSSLKHFIQAEQSLQVLQTSASILALHAHSKFWLCEIIALRTRVFAEHFLQQPHSINGIDYALCYLVTNRWLCWIVNALLGTFSLLRL